MRQKTTPDRLTVILTSKDKILKVGPTKAWLSRLHSPKQKPNRKKKLLASAGTELLPLQFGC
jgi:hypothetical protein